MVRTGVRPALVEVGTLMHADGHSPNPSRKRLQPEGFGHDRRPGVDPVRQARAVRTLLHSAALPPRLHDHDTRGSA